MSLRHDEVYGARIPEIDHIPTYADWHSSNSNGLSSMLERGAYLFLDIRGRLRDGPWDANTSLILRRRLWDQASIGFFYPDNQCRNFSGTACYTGCFYACRGDTTLVLSKCAGA